MDKNRHDMGLLAIDATSFLPRMTEHRRHLHAHPEIGLDLPDTHEYIKTALKNLGLDPEVHPSAGVTVRINGSSKSDQIRILRADMDALPLIERTGLSFSSKNVGAMHACGHDMHMAMLLAAAEMFVAQRPEFDVILAFQPGEESDRGALALLQHENLQLQGNALAFAIHVNSIIESGGIAYRKGTFMANGDWFRVTFRGPGGHASAPKLTVSPIEATAAFVIGLAEISKTLNLEEPLVATVTEILSGNTVNVIPTSGSIRGTLRSISAQHRRRLHRALTELAKRTAMEIGVTCDVEITDGYPAVVNDSRFINSLDKALNDEALGARISIMEAPSMVIEDFSYFLEKWPGAMIYLGAKAILMPSFNHSDDVIFDEKAMVTGLMLHSIVANLAVGI